MVESCDPKGPAYRRVAGAPIQGSADCRPHGLERNARPRLPRLTRHRGGLSQRRDTIILRISLRLAQWRADTPLTGAGVLSPLDTDGVAGACRALPGAHARRPQGETNQPHGSCQEDPP